MISARTSVPTPLLKDFLNEHSYMSILVTGTPPDGSCLYHAIGQCLYRDSYIQNPKWVKQYRAKLSRSITKALWTSHTTVIVDVVFQLKDVLSRVFPTLSKEIEDSPFDPQTSSLDDVKQHLVRICSPLTADNVGEFINKFISKRFEQYIQQLKNTNDFGGTEEIDFISTILGINIIIILSNGSPCRTPIPDLERQSILIYHCNNNHWESLSLHDPRTSTVMLIFPPNHFLIQRIVEHLNSPI
jgi:hypothetical protein